MSNSEQFPAQLSARIAVIGTTGSGKTTLAAQLAGLNGGRHIELDALHWEPDWVAAPLEIFRARVAEAIRVDRWVVDGNYSKVRDLVWGRATMIVWLDLSLGVILQRLTRRTLRRLLTREELWNGNRESWRNTFLSRNSLLVWALTTYQRRKRDYTRLLALPQYQYLSLVRLSSPCMVTTWLTALPRQ